MGFFSLAKVASMMLLELLVQLPDFLTAKQVNMKHLVENYNDKKHYNLTGPASGLHIGIDANVLLCSYSSTYNSFADRRDEQIEHRALYIAKRIRHYIQTRFLNFGVDREHVILVFDGNKNKNKLRHSVSEDSEELTVSPTVTGRDAVSNECHLKQCVQKKLLEFGFQCHQAFCEADHQLAYMVKSDQLHVVCTSDNDLIVHGAATLLFKNSKDSVFRLHTPQPAHQPWLLLIALLQGCDYVKGVKRIGYGTIARVIAANQSLDLSQFKRIMKRFGFCSDKNAKAYVRQCLAGYGTATVKKSTHRGWESCKYEFFMEEKSLNYFEDEFVNSVFIDNIIDTQHRAITLSQAGKLRNSLTRKFPTRKKKKSVKKVKKKRRCGKRSRQRQSRAHIAQQSNPGAQQQQRNPGAQQKGAYLKIRALQKEQGKVSGKKKNKNKNNKKNVVQEVKEDDDDKKEKKEKEEKHAFIDKLLACLKNTGDKQIEQSWSHLWQTYTFSHCMQHPTLGRHGQVRSLSLYRYFGLTKPSETVLAKLTQLREQLRRRLGMTADSEVSVLQSVRKLVEWTDQDSYILFATATQGQNFIKGHILAEAEQHEYETSTFGYYHQSNMNNMHKILSYGEEKVCFIILLFCDFADIVSLSHSPFFLTVPGRFVCVCFFLSRRFFFFFLSHRFFFSFFFCCVYLFVFFFFCS
jgi:5'-3' exonuclease